MRRLPRALVPLAASWLALGLLATAGCKRSTPVELFVDGFQPENVRFEIEDQGPLDDKAVEELARRPDVDGALRLPPGSCPGPCRVAMVSVFVHNTGADSEAPPVVRLKSPPSRPPRQPIAFRGGTIDKNRYGRIRWVVEMWPEEQSLTATLSKSVFIVDAPPPPPPPEPAQKVTP
jgi:hypothetical protein